MGTFLTKSSVKPLCILLVGWAMMFMFSVMYGRHMVGHLGGGISPSEYSEPFRWMAFTAVSGGGIALFVTLLVWTILSTQSHNRTDFIRKNEIKMRRSMLWVPLLITFFFVVGFILHVMSVDLQIVG